MKTTKQLIGTLILTVGVWIQVRAQDPFTNGLVAYYPFNGNATDASGNLNNGTVNNAILCTNRFGVIGAAYEFNGVNSSISVPDASNLNFANHDLTVSVWAELHTLSQAPQSGVVFLGKDNGGGNKPKWFFFWGYVSASIPGRNVAFHINNPSGGAYYGAPYLYSPAVGSWHHYLFVKAGTNYSLSVDGVLVSTSTGQDIPSGITAPLTIGTAEGMPSLLGQLDDIRIYNRALSTTEIEALYKYESGPRVALVKAVKPSLFNLSLGTIYQLQISDGLNNWTNYGSAFTATNTSMIYPQYFDTDNWGSLFFRAQVVP